LGQQVIQLAQGVPGFDLPSLAFQGVVDEVTAALEAIRSVAEAQPDEQDLLAQIAEIDQQQADALADIDAQIVAVNQELQATLTALSLQEQGTIRFLQGLAVDALDRVRFELALRLDELRVQELDAAARLQAVLGDKTFDQFIAEKQAQVVTELQSLNAVIRDFLNRLVGGVVPSPVGLIGGGGGPIGLIGFQHGTDYVPRTGLALLHEGEMVVPRAMAEGVRRGGGSGDVTITIAPTITMHVSGDVNTAKLTRQMDEALSDIITGPSKSRAKLIELAKHAPKRGR